MNKFTDFAHFLSGALMVIGQTLIAAFGVIIILIFVVYVEIQRVADGVALFEENGAYLGAAVLVLLLLTLEFIVHYVETKNGYEHEQQNEWSIRLFWRWLSYFFGWSSDWTPRALSPAQQIKTYSRLLTVTILALALGGSMESTIAGVDGNWMQGLQSIAFESSLEEIVEWVAGVLFALTLVIGSQRITAYVAQRASETLEHGVKQKPIHETIINHQNITDMPFMPIVIVDNISTCDACGWQSENKATQDSAARALRAHKIHCEVS